MKPPIRCALLYALFALFLAISPVAAEEVVDRRDLHTVFEDHGVNGSFAVLDVITDQLIVVNRERAFQRFIPASTFKFANSLIALELGVIADENEIIPYGGKPQHIEAWEKDMPIGEAFTVSNLPVFQELARRVGTDSYSDILTEFSYGNGAVGTHVERFWLDGPLEISAVEQVRFLAALATRTLPLSDRTQTIVRDIATIETAGNASLFGKTGWTIAPDPDIGWFVGWVEGGDGVFAFALNIDMGSRADTPKRTALARQLLAELGLY